MKSGAKRIPLNFIKIQLASPSQIRGWAERKLPNGKVVGEVRKTDTVHYNTMKPIKEGLFCEQIFGPVKDFECSCGIKSRKGLFCNECGVEFGTSQLRRYRLGYIELTSPVIHLWFLKGRTSILSELLDVPKRLLESTLYMRFSYWDTLTPKEMKTFQKEFLGTEKFFYWITNLSFKQNGTKVLKTQLENDTLLPEQLRLLYRITPTSFLYNGSLYEKSKTQPFSLALQSQIPFSSFGPQKFSNSSQELNVKRIEDSGFFLWKKKESAYSTFFASPKQKKVKANSERVTDEINFFHTKKKNKGSQRERNVLHSYVIPKSLFLQKDSGELRDTCSLIYFLSSYRKSYRLPERNKWITMELAAPTEVATLLTQKVGVEFQKIFVWDFFQRKKKKQEICTSFSIANIFFILKRINTFIAICTTNNNPFNGFYLEQKDKKELQVFQPQHPIYLGSEIVFKRKRVSFFKPYNTNTKVQVLSIVNNALHFLVNQTDDTKLFCNEAFSQSPKNFSDKRFLRVASPIIKTSNGQKSKAFKTKSLSRRLLAKLNFFKLGVYSFSVECKAIEEPFFLKKKIRSFYSLSEYPPYPERVRGPNPERVTVALEPPYPERVRWPYPFRVTVAIEWGPQKSFFLLHKKSTKTKKSFFLRGLSFWLKRREMSLKEFYTVTSFIWDIVQFPLQPFTSTTQIQGLIDNKFTHKTKFLYRIFSLGKNKKNTVKNKVCFKQDQINFLGQKEKQNVTADLIKHPLFSLLDEKKLPGRRKGSLTVFLTLTVDPVFFEEKNRGPHSMANVTLKGLGHLTLSGYGENLLLFSFPHVENRIFKRYRNSKFCYQNLDLKWGFFRFKSSGINGINQRLRDHLYGGTFFYKKANQKLFEFSFNQKLKNNSKSLYFSNLRKKKNRDFISLSVIPTTNSFSFSKKEGGSFFSKKGTFIISFLKTKHNSLSTRTPIKRSLFCDIYPCDSYFWSFYGQRPSSFVQNNQSLLFFQNIASSFPKKFERIKLVNFKLIRNFNLFSKFNLPTTTDNMYISESLNPEIQDFNFKKGLSFRNISHRAKAYSHELYSQTEYRDGWAKGPSSNKDWTLNSDWSAGYKASTHHSIETLQFKVKEIQRRAVKYGNPKWLLNLSLFLKTRDTNSYSSQFFFKDSKAITSKTDLFQEPSNDYNYSLVKNLSSDNAFFEKSFKTLKGLANQRKKNFVIEDSPSSQKDVEEENLQDYVLLTDVGTKGKALKSISFAYFGIRNLFAHLLTLDYGTEFRESLDRIANLNHEIQSLKNEIQEEPLLERELLAKIRKLLSQRSRRKRNAKALKAFKPSASQKDEAVRWPTPYPERVRGPNPFRVTVAIEPPAIEAANPERVSDISTQLKIRKNFGSFSSKEKISRVQSLNKEVLTLSGLDIQRISTNSLPGTLSGSENPLFSDPERVKPSFFFEKKEEIGVKERPFDTKQKSSLGFFLEKKETTKQKKSVPVNAEAEWAILSYLPVLPPALRPILRLNGDQLVSSDLNKLYQKILFRNERLLRVEKSSELDELNLDYAQVLLQEAVDTLIENGKGGSPPVCTETGRPYKSLSDTLKGKKGRFRQNLLGKRVDYSGRSVIVVGPKLKIYECGLPKEMGIELYLPFLIRYLLWTKKARTIVEAKIFLDKQMVIKNSTIWKILAKIMANHPVLLNRAPTLHRLGIQAFQPKLVEGKAILLHPLVCPAFNADFDGDQMAVHVPLSSQARAEAWNLLWSRNNILSPATGQPLLSPAQDMVLGCYFVTTREWKIQQGAGKWFGNLNDVLIAYNQKALALHSPVWVRSHQYIETGGQLQSPLELRVSKKGWIVELYLLSQRHSNFLGSHKVHFVRTTPGRILVNESIRRSIILSQNLNRSDIDKVNKKSKIYSLMEE